MHLTPQFALVRPVATFRGQRPAHCEDRNAESQAAEDAVRSLSAPKGSTDQVRRVGRSRLDGFRRRKRVGANRESVSTRVLNLCFLRKIVIGEEREGISEPKKELAVVTFRSTLHAEAASLGRPLD